MSERPDPAESGDPETWPPPAPGSHRRRRPLERHARWIDAKNRRDEPREGTPPLLWWILGALLLFGVLSVMVRMFLVL